MVTAIFAPLSIVLLIYSFRNVYGRNDLIMIPIFLPWRFFLIALHGVMLLLIQNGKFLIVPLLLLFSEMVCRCIFSIGFEDDVYLKVLLVFSITQFHLAVLGNIHKEMLDLSMRNIVMLLNSLCYIQ